VKLVSGSYHSLAIKADGRIVAWGRNDWGQCNVPEPDSVFFAIAGGQIHSLALKVATPVNHAPAANAGPHQNILVTEVVTLDGSGSTDVDDEDLLTFNWTFISKPLGSTATLSDPAVVNPTFVVDKPGVYIVQLIVNDGTVDSPPDWVAITSCVPGSVVAWGANAYGQCTVPAPNEDFVAISGGFSHSVGLKGDGSIVAWGNNDGYQCNVPLPNTGFVAVAAGWRHTVGLKADGSVVAWGSNYDDHGHYTAQCVVPVPNEGFVAIAAGLFHNLGLKSDGSIVAWGRNEEGQRNVPTPNTGFKAVGCGDFHSMGIKADGSIIAWGYNAYAQCNVTPPNTGFVQTDGGWRHTLGLQTDGSIRAWGSNGDSYWDVHGNWTFEGLRNIPAPNADFVKLVSGSYHSLAIKADGRIVAWGRNDWGQCNVPEPDSVFFAIAGGQIHSLALKVPTPVNHAPAANAGPDQTVFVNETVTLNGSGSTDVDGDPLTFQWAFISVPVGSVVTLSDPTAVKPTFIVDKPGVYIVQLIVNDGIVDSDPDTVRIDTTNSPPVASAGPDQSGQNGDTITLNGSGSSDVDGNPLTYQWSFTSKPSGSTAELSDATAVKPTFTIDVSGEYVAQLVVNDGTVDSATDTVTVTTLNTAPIANAGPDKSGHVGDLITLDGTDSSDVDGNPLTYQWSLTVKPAGSSAVLSDVTAVNPTFVVDIFGTYVAQLIVNDGLVNSVPNTVTVSTLNSAPVADAGADQSAYVGDIVTLDGSGSSDVDGNPLTYQWSLTSVPAGSSAALSDATAVNPTFVVDVFGTYIAQLIVNDGSVNSVPDTVTVSTLNSAPVADAGADQSAYVGDIVTLDGSGSSDVDGNPLTYKWSLTSVPTGSSAVLSDHTAISPTFEVDRGGVFVAQLIVNDGTVDSTPDTVTISTINVKPTADAGPAQSVHVGDLVTLDGSGSSDPDGDAITFSWAFTSKPAGSVAFIGDPTSVNPTFTADVAGTYTIGLVVSDGALNSEPDTVSVSTINVAPIADAGTNQAVYVGETVSLYGAASWDPDGDPIAFNWAFTSKPVGSSTALNDPAAANPAFVADVAGTYVLNLVVNDGSLDSESDSVSISTINVAPIADAGDNQSVYVGDVTVLDGSGSFDPDGDPVTYSWAFTSRPVGSLAVLDGAGSASPTFVADVPGVYVVTLVASDGVLNSQPSNVTISAITYLTQAILNVQVCIDLVNGFEPSVFNNPNNKNALTNKLNTAIDKLERGEYQDAMQKLENDILKKTDGCALSGSPDKNDWIRECESQNVLYPLILDTIALLQEVI